ncbi:MAG TPA: hypothetical protein VII39_11300 [Bradyrhizobium sp.]
MTFNTTSFFAGVGTVFAAVALGFVGGAMITTSPKVEPNRLERVTATATTPDAGVKAATPEVRSVAAKAPEEPAAVTTSGTKDEMTQSPPAPDGVISQTPIVASPPQPSPVTANPVMAKDGADLQAESAKKARADEWKRDVASKKRRAERRRERRRRDIEAVENAVLRTQPDDGQQTIPQRDDRSPRLGFFGDD